MLKLTGKEIKFIQNEKKVISNHLSKGKGWDNNTIGLKAIKKRLKEHLELQQNKLCAYCGNKIYKTSRPEIEHIAPKGMKLYPEFSFVTLNLGLSCGFCNGSSKKGQKDVVSKRSKYYGRCQFYLVHPYFDDPDDHYEWEKDVRVLIKSKTPKGKYSIDLFKLNDIYQTEARAGTLLINARKANYQLSADEEDMIDRALQ